MSRHGFGPSLPHVVTQGGCPETAVFEPGGAHPPPPPNGSHLGVRNVRARFERGMCLSTAAAAARGGGGDLASPPPPRPNHPTPHPKPKHSPLGKNEILSRDPEMRRPFLVHKLGSCPHTHPPDPPPRPVGRTLSTAPVRTRLRPLPSTAVSHPPTPPGHRDGGHAGSTSASGAPRIPRDPPPQPRLGLSQWTRAFGRPRSTGNGPAFPGTATGPFWNGGPVRRRLCHCAALHGPGAEEGGGHAERRPPSEPSSEPEPWPMPCAPHPRAHGGR